MRFGFHFPRESCTKQRGFVETFVEEKTAEKTTRLRTTRRPMLARVRNAPGALRLTRVAARSYVAAARVARPPLQQCAHARRLIAILTAPHLLPRGCPLPGCRGLTD